MLIIFKTEKLNWQSCTHTFVSWCFHWYVLLCHWKWILPRIIMIILWCKNCSEITFQMCSTVILMCVYIDINNTRCFHWLWWIMLSFRHSIP